MGRQFIANVKAVLDQGSLNAIANQIKNALKGITVDVGVGGKALTGDLKSTVGQINSSFGKIETPTIDMSGITASISQMTSAVDSAVQSMSAQMRALSEQMAMLGSMGNSDAIKQVQQTTGATKTSATKTTSKGTSVVPTNTQDVIYAGSGSDSPQIEAATSGGTQVATTTSKSSKQTKKSASTSQSGSTVQVGTTTYQAIDDGGAASTLALPSATAKEPTYKSTTKYTDYSQGRKYQSSSQKQNTRASVKSGSKYVVSDDAKSKTLEELYDDLSFGEAELAKVEDAMWDSKSDVEYAERLSKHKRLSDELDIVKGHIDTIESGSNYYSRSSMRAKNSKRLSIPATDLYRGYQAEQNAKQAQKQAQKQARQTTAKYKEAEQELAKSSTKGGYYRSSDQPSDKSPSRSSSVDLESGLLGNTSSKSRYSRGTYSNGTPMSIKQENERNKIAQKYQVYEKKQNDLYAQQLAKENRQIAKDVSEAYKDQSSTTGSYRSTSAMDLEAGLLGSDTSTIKQHANELGRQYTQQRLANGDTHKIGTYTASKGRYYSASGAKTSYSSSDKATGAKTLGRNAVASEYQAYQDRQIAARQAAENRAIAKTHVIPDRELSMTEKSILSSNRQGHLATMSDVADWDRMDSETEYWDNYYDNIAKETAAISQRAEANVKKTRDRIAAQQKAANKAVDDIANKAVKGITDRYGKSAANQQLSGLFDTLTGTYNLDDSSANKLIETIKNENIIPDSSAISVGYKDPDEPTSLKVDLKGHKMDSDGITRSNYAISATQRKIVDPETGDEKIGWDYKVSQTDKYFDTGKLQEAKNTARYLNDELEDTSANFKKIGGASREGSTKAANYIQQAEDSVAKLNSGLLTAEEYVKETGTLQKAVQGATSAVNEQANIDATALATAQSNTRLASQLARTNSAIDRAVQNGSISESTASNLRQQVSSAVSQSQIGPDESQPNYIRAEAYNNANQIIGAARQSLAGDIQLQRNVKSTQKQVDNAQNNIDTVRGGAYGTQTAGYLADMNSLSKEMADNMQIASDVTKSSAERTGALAKAKQAQAKADSKATKTMDAYNISQERQNKAVAEMNANMSTLTASSGELNESYANLKGSLAKDTTEINNFGKSAQRVSDYLSYAQNEGLDTAQRLSYYDKAQTEMQKAKVAQDNARQSFMTQFDENLGKEYYQKAVTDATKSANKLGHNFVSQNQSNIATMTSSMQAAFDESNKGSSANADIIARATKSFEQANTAMASNLKAGATNTTAVQMHSDLGRIKQSMGYVSSLASSLGEGTLNTALVGKYEGANTLAQEAAEISEQYAALASGEQIRDQKTINQLSTRVGNLKNAVNEQRRMYLSNESANATDRQLSTLNNQIESYKTANSKAYKKNKSTIDDWQSKIATARATGDTESGTSSTMSAEDYNQMRTDFKDLQTSMKASGVTGKTLKDRLVEGWQKYGSWAVVTGTMTKGIQAVRSMVNNAVSVDTAMTELKKVTDFSDADYKQYQQTAAQIAKSTGVTMTDAINASAGWARLGNYSTGELQSLATASTVYKNVGDDIESIDEATSSLVSTMQAFGLSTNNAMGVVDEFNEVGKYIAQQYSNVLIASGYIG